MEIDFYFIFSWHTFQKRNPYLTEFRYVPCLHFILFIRIRFFFMFRLEDDAKNCAGYALYQQKPWACAINHFYFILFLSSISHPQRNGRFYCGATSGGLKWLEGKRIERLKAFWRWKTVAFTWNKTESKSAPHWNINFIAYAISVHKCVAMDQIDMHAIKA